ncbi:hypothetical protein SCHPADRAFT_614169 [Schizopora paradoxa]|uniref:Uncharacterized protein n=1 Tax=Schizopora paradoxa TaxID=27342 RepID=A0A0H2R8U2_9AGAM|nr:hypothetical protein SCHPADRAFT_614169 [Schizopora paradoxa]
MKDPRLFTGPPFAEPAAHFARRIRLLGPCPTPTCPQLVHLARRNALRMIIDGDLCTLTHGGGDTFETKSATTTRNIELAPKMGHVHHDLLKDGWHASRSVPFKLTRQFLLHCPLFAAAPRGARMPAGALADSIAPRWQSAGKIIELCCLP